MEHLDYIKILFLCIFILCCSAPLKGVDIYVSGSQAGSGSGTRENPYSYTTFYSDFLNVASAPTAETDINIYFERGYTYEIANQFCSGNSVGFGRNSWHGKNVVINEYGSGTPVLFDGSGMNGVFLQFSSGRFNANNRLNLTFKNIIFENFGDNPFIDLTAAYHYVYFENVTIRNCNGSNYLMHVNQTNAGLWLSGSSIINNTRNNYLIYAQNVSNEGAVFYNNTFSGNEVSEVFRIATASVKFYNNTVYNSGNIHVNNASSGGYVINNLIAGTSGLTQGGSNAENAKRNIVQDGGRVYFYQKGISNGVDITSEFYRQFDANLTNTAVDPGKIYHTLRELTDPGHVILGKGGTQYILSSVSDLGTALEVDQSGEKRYLNYPVSIGAIDAKPYHVLSPVNIIITYNHEEGEMPGARTIQLTEANVLEYPSGVTEGGTTFVLIDESKENGSLSPFTNDFKTTFNPRLNEEGQIVGENTTCSYKYKAISSGNRVETIGEIKITVYDQSRPPGLIDPSDNPTTGFDYMGAVEFGSTYKFITGFYGNDNKTLIENYLANNPAEDRLYGLQIPLVGDLNGDGYPEIVALGIQDNNNNPLANTIQYIYVYNGQTGERLVKFPFPDNFTWANGSYHYPPSQLALVDSDRNGRGEIIIAYGYKAGASQSRSVASFEIALDAHNNIVGLTEKWNNKSVLYDAPLSFEANYVKPIPQVVDIDGDGTPEVIVYNKIYNAVNGEFIMSLGTLGTDVYVGRDAGARDADRCINFSYLYDVDLDGKYDYIAGGQVYYDIDLESDSYKKISCKDINTQGIPTNTDMPDGRTGVADINGDGIPDIVVVKRTSDNSLTIYVWDPDLLYPDENDNNKIKRRPTGYIPNPKILAKKVVNISTGGGPNSYVYIGDIDGRVQEVTIDGITRQYRLPEITVLGENMSFSPSTKTQAHPNVRDIATGGTTYGLPTSGSSFVLTAYTWDADPDINISERLKLSFILGHQDASASTGFTMFDFDNDGVQEICYRDMNYLRIIKATVPYVATSFDETHVSGAILFRRQVNSFTGFEYPVIADIDNDASAEMVVLGHNQNANFVQGFVYAVGAGKDKFAPALPVWNQCMYSPFKINPDLTTPIGKAINPLDPAYTYRREIKDENGNVVEVIPEYKPYNGTLLQVPYHMTIDDGNGNPNFEPIVYLVESYIDEDHTYMEGSNIKIRIGNHATARTDVSENTPIRVYSSSIAAGNLDKAVDGGLHTIRSLGHTAAIRSGEYVDLTIPVSAPTGVYYIRLGDNSDSSTGSWVWRYGKNKASDAAPPGQAVGIGVTGRAYRDCDWSDNMAIVATFAIVDDYATVQEYNTLPIDILENDIFPEVFFDNAFSLCDSIVVPPKAGTVDCIGNGKKTRIIYTHIGNEELPDGFDSFEYKMAYFDENLSPAQWVELTAKVYIYVLQNEIGGFSACYGTTTTVQLKESPADGVKFYWFVEDEEEGMLLSGSPNPRSTTTLTNMQDDSVYYVIPVITGGTYSGISFPFGKLTIPVIDAGESTLTFIWTGIMNNNWFNPTNWMQENQQGNQYPTRYVPSSCVDVVIPAGAPNYPELTRPAECRQITLQNRAMIAGIHHLIYESAKVELSLKSTEKERFVMWSAPMKNVYTGDYHFRTENNKPVWQGDVYMNFFQAHNPDYPDQDPGSGAQNAFTATFGNVGVELSLGQAFNIKVDNRDTDKTFYFPKKEFTSYQDKLGNHLTPRPEAHRFILDRADFEINGVLQEEIDMPVRGDNTYVMIQVVNPFMAWLDMTAFLKANEGVLERGYKIWDGRTEDSFVTIRYDETGQRYYITDPAAVETQTTGYIPPLQSFLVMKTNNAPLQTLKISSAWTTTLPGVSGSYSLRNSTDEGEPYILRVSATTAGGANSTLLYYNDMAEPGYRGDEDIRKLFNPESTLEVYTFSSTREPLDFYASGDYSRDVRLGIRMAKAQPLTLAFSGMECFSHDVYLIDHDDNEKTYDLATNPVLTFAVEAYSTGSAIDLPNRFSLSFKYNPTSTEAVPDDELVVLSSGGHLHISAGGKEIDNLQVYNLWGQIVYQSRKPGTHFKVPAKPNQFYIVKGQVNYQIRIVKAMAK